MKVIAIHGNGQSKSLYKDIKDFELMELAGHGEAKRLDNYSLEAHVKYLNDLIKEPVIVLAQSFSAHVAIRLAKLNPNIKKLVCTSMLPVSSLEEFGKVVKPESGINILFTGETNKDKVRAFIKNQQNSDSLVDELVDAFFQLDPKHGASLYADMVAGIENEYQILEEIKIPVSFLFGADDKLMNLDYIKQSSVDFKIIEGAGHNIIVDRPEAVLEYIKA